MWLPALAEAPQDSRVQDPVLEIEGESGSFLQVFKDCVSAIGY